MSSTLTPRNARGAAVWLLCRRSKSCYAKEETPRKLPVLTMFEAASLPPPSRSFSSMLHVHCPIIWQISSVQPYTYPFPKEGKEDGGHVATTTAAVRRER